MYVVSKVTKTGAVLLQAVLIVSVVAAQTNQKVSGVVRDQAGGSMPKVKISFKSKNVRQTVYSDENGEFQLSLPTGNYSVISRVGGCKKNKLENWLVGGSKNTLLLNIQLDCPPTQIIN
jgi:hypothetical protein